MKITLEYVATLKVSGPPSGASLDLPEGATVTGLLDRLQLSSAHQKVIVPFVNEAKVRPETVLKPGDHVFLAMPVGGG